MLIPEPVLNPKQMQPQHPNNCKKPSVGNVNAIVGRSSHRDNADVDSNYEQK
jgi:hypothetical protein